MWSSSYRKAEADDQIKWMKRKLYWLDAPKKENPYYYKLNKQSERIKYLNNFFKALKSYKEVIAEIERRRSYAEGINFLHLFPITL